MNAKYQQQAMPKKGAPVESDTQINPGKAGPKGALELEGAGRTTGTRSGSKRNNVRRDFVNGPSRKRGGAKTH